jgi:1-deoxy-D-xylulose-5-phosphate synthase
VLHYLAATGGLDRGRVVRTLMLPDKFIDQASPAQMYAWAGLTAADIAETVRTTAGKAQVSKLPSRPKLA